MKKYLSLILLFLSVRLFAASPSFQNLTNSPGVFGLISYTVVDGAGIPIGYSTFLSNSIIVNLDTNTLHTRNATYRASFFNVDRVWNGAINGGNGGWTNANGSFVTRNTADDVIVLATNAGLTSTSGGDYEEDETATFATGSAIYTNFTAQPQPDANWELANQPSGNHIITWFNTNSLVTNGVWQFIITNGGTHVINVYNPDIFNSRLIGQTTITNTMVFTGTMASNTMLTMHGEAAGTESTVRIIGADRGGGNNNGIQINTGGGADIRLNGYLVLSGYGNFNGGGGIAIPTALAAMEVIQADVANGLVFSSAFDPHTNAIIDMISQFGTNTWWSVTSDGKFTGNAVGLTNLQAANLTGTLPSSSMATNFNLLSDNVLVLSNKIRVNNNLIRIETPDDSLVFSNDSGNGNMHWFKGNAIQSFHHDGGGDSVTIYASSGGNTAGTTKGSVSVDQTGVTIMNVAVSNSIGVDINGVKITGNGAAVVGPLCYDANGYATKVGGFTGIITNLWSTTVSNRCYYTNGLLMKMTVP